MSRDYEPKTKLGKLYRIPDEEISCPSCGKIYGHHKTKVCKTCEECSKCCSCDDNKKELIEATKFIEDVILQ